MHTNLPGFTAETSLARRGEKYTAHIQQVELGGYVPAADRLFWSPPEWITRNLWGCRVVENIVCDPPTEPGTLFGPCHWDGTYRVDCSPVPR